MSFPPIEELLPHRGTMLLLDRVVAFAGGHVMAECSPRRDAWYADTRGNMPAWIGIELMAQAIAAHSSLGRRSEGKPAVPGVLLGTRRFTAVRSAFTAGEMLRITAVRTLRDESGFAAYDCTIASGDVELASATLKAFEPPDFQAFLHAAGP